MDTTNPQALVDWAPVARIMLLGIVVALGPLAWVWLRNRRANVQQRLRALTLLTLFLTFDLVLFGAFTRLTDSGLGCPDWPGCYGTATPLGAVAQITAEQNAMPSGPVTHQKAWIEMIHRYLASGVGVLLIVLTVASWLQLSKSRQVRGAPAQDAASLAMLSPWWPTVTLVWVCIQGAFGALTVTMKLFPAIVTMHLLGGMVLLSLLQAQATRYGVATENNSSSAASHAPISRAMLWALVIGFVLLWLQIALGGWVSTNYAVLACTEFPKCQGEWLPPMAMREGFEIWRPLGQTGSGQSVGFASLTAIHIVHRSFAFIVFAWLGVVALRLRNHTPLRRCMQAIAAVLLLQLVSGLSNVVLGWPLLAAVAHTGGAAVLVLLLTHALVYALRSLKLAPTSQPTVLIQSRYANFDTLA